MPSYLEKLILDSLDFNDENNFVIEDLSFKPAEPKPLWAANADADGEELVEEPHYTNAYFEMQIRVVAAANTDAALEALGELIDKLQGCARAEGGLPLEWTPNNASTTYTWYAIMGEIAELPVTVTGDLAGWFVESPVLKVRLTCRPFGHTDERAVLAAVESSLSLQVAYIDEIGGDVPAEGRMVLTDKATQNRRYLEWGQDVVASEVGNPSLLLEADKAMEVTGFIGELATRTGSVSTKAIKAVLVASPATICSTGKIAHFGSYRLKLRAEATAEGVTLRASYRVGDGTWTTLPWVAVPGVEASWFEIDLSEVFLGEVERGEQVSEIRIQGKAANGGTVYVDLLDLMPTRRYGVARAPLTVSTPSALNAYDSFNQSSGALSGKTAEIGGAWSGAGDADDFTINTTSHAAQRTALSDVSGTPRYATLGSNKYTDIFAEVDVTSTNPYELGKSNASMGLLLRYVDTSNWARLVLYAPSIGGAGGGGGSGYNHWYAVFQKKVAGVLSYFLGPSGSAALGPNGSYLPIITGAFGVAIKAVTLEALILADGSWRVGAKGETYASGSDSAFATGGALAEGKVGIVDEKTSSLAETRTYDGFVAWVPDVGYVCRSGRSVELNAGIVERENSTGAYWSPVPIYRGASFLLDPAGDEGRVNRLAVKMRRADTTDEPDANLTDKQRLEVLARERFLAPR